MRNVLRQEGVEVDNHCPIYNDTNEKIKPLFKDYVLPK